MTEQEKQEFWRNQQLFTMNDIIRTPNGAILLNPRAMAKVEEEYQIEIPKGRIFSLREARDLIINEETKRRQKITASSTESEKSTGSAMIEKVASYFKILPLSKKSNLLFIGKELNRIFYRVKPSEVIQGIQLAQEQGLIDNADDIIKSYHNQLGLRALAVNFEKIGKTEEPDVAVNKLAAFIFANYKHGFSYGQVKQVLGQSSLSNEMKKQITDRFYELLMPDVLARYQDTKLRGSLLAKDILEHYDEFDMERIFAILDIGLPDFQIDKVRYEAYRIEDESYVRDILLDGNRKRLSAAEIVQQLENLQSEYPKECILATICDMRSKHLVLPYDDIINGYLKSNVVDSKFEPTPEVPIHKEEANELIPVNRQVFELSPSGDFIIPNEEGTELSGPEILSSSDFEPISTGKKHRVINREKAVTPKDKKAVIAGLVVAAGAISTAVLTTIFKVSPLEAAKNAAASIASFAAGNVFLSQILPATASLVGNLSLFGLAAVGTVTWLKRVKAKQKEQRKQEILDVLEEVRKAEAEKGGRTR